MYVSNDQNEDRLWPSTAGASRKEIEADAKIVALVS